jgi:demethylmenaquinone methyltransferase / 2-methoxy-6-polyprenyl-1,4-benzoquinol methylase
MEYKTIVKSEEFDKSSSTVRGMFARIAPRYDVANTILSGGIHHYWRRVLLHEIGAPQRVLDIASGTGDLIPLLQTKSSCVVGLDFCPPMLERAPEKARKSDEIAFIVGDALNLPFEDKVFDCITISFGVRNFAQLEKGLVEALRVIKQGGTLLVLEFGQPKNTVWREIFSLYSRVIMPSLGGLITGNRNAYSYLPKTSAAFPCGAAFSEILKSCGFRSITVKSLCGGVAYLYKALRR